MVKLIGVFLIVTGLLSLAAGAFVDWKFGSTPEVTGNVISSIMQQPKVPLNFFDYFEAFAFSYSIFSLIMGIMFLARV